MAKYKNVVCANCDKQAVAKGLCIMHYHRLIKGRPLDLPSKLCCVCEQAFVATRRNKIYCSYTCKNRDLKYKRAYGVTAAVWNCLYTKQGGRCYICKEEPTRRRLNLDHCHKTGAIRGLLCDSCNLHLGWCEQYGSQMAEYLSRPATMIVID